MPSASTPIGLVAALPNPRHAWVSGAGRVATMPDHPPASRRPI